VILTCISEEEAVRHINALLVEDGSPEELYRELRRAEADLGKINDTNSPIIYHGELTRTRNAAERVSNDIFHILLSTAISLES